ncbi:MASE1 domain-containing protein [Aestuariivita boseongensis]|uniref:MASE1 domain-containing protein n=1 Tax=Aestuariivita boseongensis TaxID=1470562 RepID=UPI000682CFB9|nr:MASE1 domain-containing protein [Aestuariivita boseongensis]
MSFLWIVAAYVLCHGLTTFLVYPLQSSVLPEATVFASLIYLPHGVRVLATWALGWKALPALVLGSVLASVMFTPSDDLNLLEPVLIESILVGAVSAFLAFELFRLAGFHFYSGGAQRLRWRGMILIGAVSSVINSVGQTLVFSGIMQFDLANEVLLIYAVGDLLGLVLCMVALMYIFRWMRGRRSSVQR